MSIRRSCVLVLAVFSTFGLVACTSTIDELATCVEGRWKLTPAQPGDASAALDWLPQSMVVYEIQRSRLVVSTSTGEVIEEKRFSLEPKDRRHGWLDVEGGERVEVGADESCGSLSLASEGSRFELQRVAE